MKAFAIKRLDTGEFWTGKKWGQLRDAKEWLKLSSATKRARILADENPGVFIATVQTV
jgi:hypothetical protein